MNTIALAAEKSMRKLSDEITKDQLTADFKVVVADAEALLKATANQSGEKIAEVRVRVEESLRVVKARMAEAQEALVAKTKEAAKVADVYVHENPWNAVGVAAAVGLVIGWLLGRR